MNNQQHVFNICTIQIKSTLRFAVSIEWICTLLSYHASKGYYSTKKLNCIKTLQQCFAPQSSINNNAGIIEQSTSNTMKFLLMQACISPVK